MRREYKRNKIIIIVLITIMCLMGVGYAAFQTKLTITGTGNISGEWNVKITNVEVAEEYGGGENVVTDFTLTTAELEANLYDKGDYVLYNITVENAGTFDAKLESLNLRQSTNDAVLITSSGFIKGEVLGKHSQKTLQVKIEYNSNYDGEDPAGTSGMAEVQLDFVQNSGGTIQPAQDYLLTYDYTTNGGTSTDAENAYLQEGSNINLNYTAEKEGYKFSGWNTNPSATEGLKALTMPGNELTLYAIFEYIDVTPPIINNVSTTSTVNTITVVTTATEEEGEIAKYEYSIDNGSTWIKVEGTNTYTFTGLVSDTEYTVKVRAVNKDDYYTEESTTIKTKAIEMPTFSEKETDAGKTVTIVYPSGCGNGLTCSYQKDSGTWTNVTTTTQDVEFTEEGTLVAKVTDGTKTITTASYTVSFPKIGASGILALSNIVTSGDGLYEDSYEDERYIYKGANPNNYITFNDELWRIISLEIDGTIKIVRSNSIGDMDWDSGGSNNWTKPATINAYLNGEYYNSLTETAKGQITSYAWGIGAVVPSNDDLAGQIVNENGTTWSGNIGLISISDYLRANTNTVQCGTISLNDNNYSTCKTTDWIYSIVPFDGYLWTISPNANSSSAVFSVRGYDRYPGRVNGGVAPSLYLSSNIQITGGEGSSSNPYTISL